MAYNVTPPPTAGPSGTKAFHTILAGRKCYRVSKDKNEVVWPPHLEAALMEGPGPTGQYTRSVRPGR